MSMLDQAELAEKAKTVNWIKALLVGASKEGKTLSSITLPLIEDKPILAIGLTPRTRATLAGVPNVKLLEIFEDEARTVKKSSGKEFRIVAKAWDRLYDTAIELWTLARGNDPFPYSGVVLDDLSAANRFSMSHVLSLKKANGKETEKNLAGVQTRAHYVPQMHLMTQLFYSLLVPLPCHIVVCGHYALYENEDTGISAYFPKVYGNLREEIPSWFNEVYLCESKTDRATGEVTYFWNTSGTGQMSFLGSTMNKQNKVWKSPVEINLDENPCGFAKLESLCQSTT